TPAIRSPVLDNNNAPKPSRRLLAFAANARRPRVMSRVPRKPATGLSRDIGPSGRRSSAAAGTADMIVLSNHRPMMTTVSRPTDIGVGTTQRTSDCPRCPDGPGVANPAGDDTRTSAVTESPGDPLVHNPAVTAPGKSPQSSIEHRHGPGSGAERYAIGTVIVLPTVVTLQTRVLGSEPLWVDRNEFQPDQRRVHARSAESSVRLGGGGHPHPGDLGPRERPIRTLGALDPHAPSVDDEPERPPDDHRVSAVQSEGQQRHTDTAADDQSRGIAGIPEEPSDSHCQHAEARQTAHDEENDT